MRTVVFGAGGIIGQTMIEQGFPAVYVRRTAGGMFEGLDLTDYYAAAAFLTDHQPNIIINLAGENRVDVVESAPELFEDINVHVPLFLSGWADGHICRYVHVSTQGVFSGDDPPYGTAASLNPITNYGRQKAKAELLVRQSRSWMIVRLTFVLGVRPQPGIGRINPLEQMFGSTGLQVDDRWFSPVMATDAAHLLGLTAQHGELQKIYHLGVPSTVCRADIADLASQYSGHEVVRVSHSYWPEIAPRPVDTTWNIGSMYTVDLEQGMAEAWEQWKAREYVQFEQRVKDICTFLQVPVSEVETRLRAGFGHNHAEVANDFNKTTREHPDNLLNWYRETDSYIYELSAYHMDDGFNYSGMSRGIAEHLVNNGVQSVLVLGDGVGDLSLTCAKYGVATTYNDLDGSRTAEFAQHLFNTAGADINLCLTSNWEPNFGGRTFDAIVALDFFEHLVNVEDWVTACHAALNPKGWFLAQNAFGIGDAEHGNSIPMHLTQNNHFEKDWDPLLNTFTWQHTGGWWRMP